MPRLALLLFAILSLAAGLAAAQDDPPAVSAEPSPADLPSAPPEWIAVAKRDFTSELSRDGTFVPAEYDEIAVWAEEYGGELVVIEVLAHGSPVNAGDVIARFDLRAIDRQILQAERDVRSAEIRLANARAQAEIDFKREQQTLESARKDLELARRSLEGWEGVELDLMRRETRIRQQYSEHSIQDQEAELEQLEAMYRDDELTDATEEIVLQRSRRNLARSRESLKLQVERVAYDEAFSEAIQTEQRRKDVEAKVNHVERLERQAEIDGRSRRDGLAQAEDALSDRTDRLRALERDRGLLTIVAPRAGVLLHGAANDYRPGRVAPRYERGHRGAVRAALFTVAAPDRVHLALEVPESELAAVNGGAAVAVDPVAAPGTTFYGTLDLDAYPAPRSAGAPANTYEAIVRLETPASGIKPGMRGKAKVATETLRDVIVLPKSAVVGAGDDAHCWTAGAAAGEGYRRVALRLGPEKDGEIVVYGEILENEKVLLCAPQK